MGRSGVLGQHLSHTPCAGQRCSCPHGTDSSVAFLPHARTTPRAKGIARLLWVPFTFKQAGAVGKSGDSLFGGD